MGYITKKTLAYGKRFIPKGGEVPADYKRLEQGIRCGWIVNEDGSAATPLPPKETKVKKFEPKTIDSLDYLNATAKASLGEKGIKTIADLRSAPAAALDELKGIGPSIAKKLVEEYETFMAGHLGENVYDYRPVGEEAAGGPDGFDCDDDD